MDSDRQTNPSTSQRNGKEPPPILPKPVLDDRTTVMKLRVNFSPQDLDDEALQNETEFQGLGSKPPERKNSLLLESMMKAMQRNSAAEFDEENDEIYGDTLPSWVTDSERRDSVEQTRIKLAMKGPGGASKGRNQRDRRRLRDKRRSTGVSIFNEIRNSVDLDDNEWNIAETKKNTALNEQPFHQLMHQQGETSRPNHQTFQLSSTSATDVLRSSLPRQQFSGLINATQPQPSKLLQSTNFLFDELEKELDALVKGLDTSSEKGSYTDSGVGSDYSTGTGSTQL